MERGEGEGREGKEKGGEGQRGGGEEGRGEIEEREKRGGRGDIRSTGRSIDWMCTSGPHQMNHSSLLL